MKWQKSYSTYLSHNDVTQIVDLFIYFFLIGQLSLVVQMLFLYIFCYKVVYLHEKLKYSIKVQNCSSYYDNQYDVTLITVNIQETFLSKNRKRMSLSSTSEIPNTSEFLENLEDMFSRCNMNFLCLILERSSVLKVQSKNCFQ